MAKVTIEFGDNSEADRSIRGQKSLKRVSILKIHLRLPELEFADPLLMAKRHQIREIYHRLDSLIGEYEKKQQECIIAAAEDAWRAIWFEE